MSQDAEFERLANLYYEPLYRFAFSLTRQENDACDLTQQTFLVWATKGHQLKDKSKAKSWLFTTLHREFLMRHRRIVRFPQIELDDARCEIPDVPPATANRLDSGAVLDALARIDPTFRAPVSLFYLEDCRYAEIAAILDVPLGTVKSRISRGISQLQNLMRKNELRNLERGTNG